MRLSTSGFYILISHHHSTGKIIIIIVVYKYVWNTRILLHNVHGFEMNLITNMCALCCVGDFPFFIHTLPALPPNENCIENALIRLRSTEVNMFTDSLSQKYMRWYWATAAVTTVEVGVRRFKSTKSMEEE